ncbi:MAG: class I SAM-dependent methyltransferase [Pararobbsia sp.]
MGFAGGPCAVIRRTTRGTDPGEAAAVSWVSEHCAGQPLLDIGIGAGRTVPLLQAVSADYVGVDYTASLLACAHERFPAADLRHMDARDMSTLPSNHFALAMFSYNGIDSVDYEGRARILAEMKRVVRPGGLLLFSSHNRHGPGYGEDRLETDAAFSRSIRSSSAGARCDRCACCRSASTTTGGIRRPTATTAAMRSRSAPRTTSASSSSTRRSPSNARSSNGLGLELEAVFRSSDGQAVPVDGDSDAWWLHFIARKPLEATAPGPSTPPTPTTPTELH